jgi:hypothetical protein
VAYSPFVATGAAFECSSNGRIRCLFQILDPQLSVISRNHLEVAIAINPTNPDNLFAFSNAELGTAMTGSIGLFAAYSMDGGENWDPVDPTDPTDWIIADGGDNLVTARADPSVAWDDFGNLFITYVSLSPQFQNPVAVSINGGITFSHLETLGVGIADQPTVAVGPIIDGTSSVWVTYKDFGVGGDPLVVQGAEVAGLGIVGAFDPVQIIPGTKDCFFNDIAVGPIGQVLTVCQRDVGRSNPNGPNDIVVNLDPDGLDPAPFGPGIFVGTTNVGWDDDLPVMEDRGMVAEVGIVYDRSELNNGRVYLLYTDEIVQESDDLDILVTYSDNDGEDVLIDEELVSSWSTPVQVNDDTTEYSQFLPRIALDQTSGFVAVSWHDSRNDDGGIGPGNRKAGPNNDAQLFASESIDGGLTFLPNVQVSAGTSSEDDAEPQPTPLPCCQDLDYGDYTGLAYEGGNFYPAWADNSNSTGLNPDGPTKMDILTAKVVPEPGQLLMLSSGIMALWGLSSMRLRGRVRGRRLE